MWKRRGGALRSPVKQQIGVSSLVRCWINSYRSLGWRLVNYRRIKFELPRQERKKSSWFQWFKTIGKYVLEMEPPFPFATQQECVQQKANYFTQVVFFLLLWSPSIPLSVRMRITPFNISPLHSWWILHVLNTRFVEEAIFTKIVSFGNIWAMSILV
jgi:hypothetical protein